MVDITPPPAAGRQVINAYGDGGFRIGNERYEGAVIVLPDRTRTWAVGEFDDLAPADFEPLRRAEPAVELLVLGTGTRLRRLPRDLEAQIRAWGISVELMDTGAACRTYNVLLLEERRVAAALLPVA